MNKIWKHVRVRLYIHEASEKKSELKISPLLRSLGPGKQRSNGASSAVYVAPLVEGNIIIL